MPFAAHVVQVLIASPGDVSRERSLLREAIWGWNDEHAAALGVVLLPVGWETHSRPELGGHPQHLIDRQLAEGADVLIGVFWTRLGTPTPDADSGTVHEIESFHKAGKAVLLYFSNAPAVLDTVDVEQVKAVRAFREKAEGWGLVGRYDDVDDLVHRARTALLRLVRENYNLPTATPPTSPPAGAPQVLADVNTERRVKGTDKRGKVQYSTHHYLIIRNIGERPARNVRLAWDGEGPEVYDLDQVISDLPAGGQGVRLPMLLTMGSPRSGALLLKWEDDEGGLYEERQTVRP